MKNKITLCLLGITAIIIASSFFYQKSKLTIWMMGDSTMAIKDKRKYPETGWGVPFATMFQSNVEVKNLAKNGRSSKSFINEGLWQQVYDGAKPGDYVFIQFGHNDEKVDKPSTGVYLDEYKANLSMFVAKVREKEATPVLLTSIARRAFENGKLVDTHKGYPEAVRQVADSLGVVLIDLTAKTEKLLSKKGEKGSVQYFLHLAEGHENYPKGIIDNTHLNTVGAKVIADLVVKDIKKQKLPLRKVLK